MNEIRRHFPDLPPVWAFGIAVAAIGIGRLPPIGPFADEFYRYLGLYMIGAGLLVAAWAAWYFRARRTTIEPRGEPAHLIAEGPFRINRNPIYSGMVLVVFGANFALGGPLGVLVCALFPVVVTRRFVAGEERTLLRRFGAEAERYLATTRRW